ncbi:MAG TPA: Zn-ribbon domain-containing OB-fold protein, partial [Acidimicrobiales bacterium]|nr:Zn-ribbon domain-containing OB-fold protein [Acidimicrobiales bacterium]
MTEDDSSVAHDSASSRPGDMRPLQPVPGERPPRARPAPVPEPEAAEYWAAARRGKLLLQHCGECGRYQLYPRSTCLVCHAPVSWSEASGRGTVYSFTVIRQNHSRPFRDWIPYVVALVDLEEGPRLMTNVVGCDPDDVQVGMAVQA